MIPIWPRRQTCPFVGGGGHIQLLAVQDVIEALRINDEHTWVVPLETAIQSIDAVAAIQNGPPKGHHKVQVVRSFSCGLAFRRKSGSGHTR